MSVNNGKIRIVKRRKWDEYKWYVRNDTITC